MAALKEEDGFESQSRESETLTPSSSSANHIKSCPDFHAALKELPEYGICMAVTGTRASGKTHLLKYIMSLIYKSRKIDTVFLISATAKQQHDDSAYDYIPQIFRFTQLGRVEEILEKQQEVVDKNKLLQAMYEQDGRGSKKKPKFATSRITIILDDFFAMGVTHHKGLTSLCTHGRHLTFTDPSTKEVLCRVDAVFLSQDLTQMNTVMRSNLDYIVSARAMSFRAQKMTVEAYLTIGLTRKEGRALLSSLSDKPYTFAFINIVKQPKSTVTDYVYFCRAPKTIRKFRIGKKEYFEIDT